MCRSVPPSLIIPKGRGAFHDPAAAVLDRPGSPLRLTTVEVEPPGSGEVRIRIRACGDRRAAVVPGPPAAYFPSEIIWSTVKRSSGIAASKLARESVVMVALPLR